MNSAKMNNWLQIVANAGIVIGLLLVGFQMKQNSDLLKTQLLYDESRRIVDFEMQMLGDEPSRVWAKSMTEPMELTLEERRAMEAMLWIYAEHVRATRLLAELGLLEDDEWRGRVLAESGFYYGNPYGLAWWKNYSEDNANLPQDLVDAVNERLASASASTTLDYFDGQLENLEMTENEADASDE